MVKQVSNSPLKKNPKLQNGLNFAFLSSYWIQFCFLSFILLPPQGYGDCLFIENGFGFEIGSAVLYDISAVWKIKFNDGLFFVKNLVKECNIVDHSVI